MGKMITENFCDECDEVIHALVDEDDFYNHKIGRVICPSCKTIIRMCNECEEHDNCGNCPYANSAIVEAMSEEEYFKWCIEHDHSMEWFLNGNMGDHYKKMAEEYIKNHTPSTDDILDVLRLLRPDNLSIAVDELRNDEHDTESSDKMKKVFEWVDALRP